MKYVFAVSALLAAASSSATVINGTHGGSIQYVTGGAVVTDGSGVTYQGRTWEAPSSRGAAIRETLKAPVGGNLLEFSARRTVPPLAIAKAAAFTAARVLPTVAVGVALWDLWDHVGVRPDGSGGLAFDPGQPPSEIRTVQCSTMVGQGTGPGTLAKNSSSTGQGACEPLLAQVPSNWNTGSAGPAYPVGAMQCSQAESGSCTQNFFVPFLGTQVVTLSFAPVVLQQCPPVVDFSDPRYSVPGGPVLPDGKCPTGRYSSPITADAAAARLENFAPPSSERLNQLGEDILTRGGEIPGASERQLSGPASKTGQPQQSTTTNPDGSSRVETKTPTTNYSYADNRISYTTTVITTINNNGQITTNEETKPPEIPDQCKQNPNSVGCAEMDQPSGPELEKQDKPVSVTPDSGWGADAGSCPPPITASVLGQPVVIDNSLICQFMSGIRFAVIGMAGLAAALIFLGGFKDGT